MLVAARGSLLTGLGAHTTHYVRSHERGTQCVSLPLRSQFIRDDVHAKHGGGYFDHRARSNHGSRKHRRCTGHGGKLSVGLRSLAQHSTTNHHVKKVCSLAHSPPPRCSLTLPACCPALDHHLHTALPPSTSPLHFNSHRQRGPR